MLTFIKKMLEAFGSPMGIVSLLFLAGLIASGSRRRPRLGTRMIRAGILLYLIFMFTPLAEVLMAGLERPYSPLLHPDPASGIRTIVVLSANGDDFSFLPATDNIAGETESRLVEGIRIYRELPGARLILSGGVLHAGDRPVATVMAEFSKEMGIPAQDIVQEGRSLTTYENLVEVKKIIGETPFILVTSACDLWRAMAVAHKLGMKPLAAPAVIRSAQHYPAGLTWRQWAGKLLQGLTNSSVERIPHLQWVYHEYLGYLWYWVLRRV